MNNPILEFLVEALILADSLPKDPALPARAAASSILRIALCVPKCVIGANWKKPEKTREN